MLFLAQEFLLHGLSMTRDCECQLGESVVHMCAGAVIDNSDNTVMYYVTHQACVHISCSMWDAIQ